MVLVVVVDTNDLEDHDEFLKCFELYMLERKLKLMPCVRDTVINHMFDLFICIEIDIFDSGWFKEVRTTDLAKRFECLALAYLINTYAMKPMCERYIDCLTNIGTWLNEQNKKHDVKRIPSTCSLQIEQLKSNSIEYSIRPDECAIKIVCILKGLYRFNKHRCQFAVSVLI